VRRPVATHALQPGAGRPERFASMFELCVMWDGSRRSSASRAAAGTPSSWPGDSTSTASGTDMSHGSFVSRSCGRASTSGCEQKTSNRFRDRTTAGSPAGSMMTSPSETKPQPVHREVPDIRRQRHQVVHGDPRARSRRGGADRPRCPDRPLPSGGCCRTPSRSPSVSCRSTEAVCSTTAAHLPTSPDTIRVCGSRPHAGTRPCIRRPG
jgi:hypothetical protein